MRVTKERANPVAPRSSRVDAVRQGIGRVAGVSAKTRFRHYLNLDRTQARLARLLRDFRWDRADRVFLDGVK